MQCIHRPRSASGKRPWDLNGLCCQYQTQAY